MAKKLLHKDPTFKDLINIVASEMSINPYLVEKDYWIMHCLYVLLSLSVLKLGVMGIGCLRQHLGLRSRLELWKQKWQVIFGCVYMLCGCLGQLWHQMMKVLSTKQEA